MGYILGPLIFGVSHKMINKSPGGDDPAYYTLEVQISSVAFLQPGADRFFPMPARHASPQGRCSGFGKLEKFQARTHSDEQMPCMVNPMRCGTQTPNPNFTQKEQRLHVTKCVSPHAPSLQLRLGLLQSAAEFFGRSKTCATNHPGQWSSAYYVRSFRSPKQLTWTPKVRKAL